MAGYKRGVDRRQIEMSSLEDKIPIESMARDPSANFNSAMWEVVKKLFEN